MRESLKRNHTIGVGRTTSLQRDILRTILYFDIFNFPLNAGEIYRFLPSNSTNIDAVQSSCSISPLKELLKNENGFYSLKSNSLSTLTERRKKEIRAKNLLSAAKLMASILKQIPFVRAIGLSGELAKGVASEDGDIDFFIITAARRLWICRTLIILLKKVFLFNSKRFLCVNHFISEDHLPFEGKNFYTAVEIATLQPLSNDVMLREYQIANEWISEYLPNAGSFLLKEDASRSQVFQRMLEHALPSRLLDKFDNWLLRVWKNIWRRRYRSLTEEKRNELFKATPFISTAYGKDFLTAVLDSYNSRLVSYHLTPLD